ncbi:hypothetical protein [Burkholderia gladioli]|uniref:hypothetical protein n=1 Tax=Burkholderia gladioli TaxID=28095 RepID=UPI001C2172A5|nr:hypothetical protein [Burkholderia gladioli]MBU9188942.1 hypothetical protein [Burkholderia gladioli]
MSGMEIKKTEKKHIADWPWSVIVSVLGFVLLGAAYLLSDAYYNKLLDLFWIDSKAFPIDKAAHLTLSVWSTLNAVVGFQVWLGRHKEFVFWNAAFILVLIALWMSIDYASYRIQVWKRKNQLVRQRPLILRAIISYIPVSSLFLALMVCGWFLSFLLLILISVPAEIGKATAENIAINLKKDFDLGCEKSKERCQILLKDGREVARGYVLVQSENRIAIYYRGGTRQIPLEGIEIRTADRSPTR